MNLARPQQAALDDTSKYTQTRKDSAQNAIDQFFRMFDISEDRLK